MKHAWPMCLMVLLGILSAAAGAGEPANAMTPEDIHRLMIRVNEWQIAHPVMKESDRNWERATWYTGVMAAYGATGDERFLKQAVEWGRQHRWLIGTEASGANRLFCVQTWTQLYLLKKDRAMIEPALRWLDAEADGSPAEGKVWYFEDGRRYADSLYGASALAMLTRATGQRRYLGYMHAFFWDVHAELFDNQAGLFYRDKRFIGQQSKSGRKVIWSRGNGWVLAGIARILEYLPGDDPQRPRYVELFRTMSGSLARCQGPQGLWPPNLADPGEVALPESSGSGFFCYAMAWGVRNGMLDRERYLPVVQKAWSGLVGCVSPEGKVRWGQPVGDRPVQYAEERTHEFVTGTFLLAASEMVRLANPAR